MVILAFPAMGKTPLAKKNGHFIDLDFGHFREALGVEKAKEAKLLKPFAKLVRLYEDSGFTVLSNDPKLMDVLDVGKVYLPSNFKYAAKKMHQSPDTIQEWVSGWASMAKKHNVPVVYLKTGLDHYLSDRRVGLSKQGGEVIAKTKGNT